jgi:hypothetical protein
VQARVAFLSTAVQREGEEREKKRRRMKREGAQPSQSSSLLSAEAGLRL